MNCETLNLGRLEVIVMQSDQRGDGTTTSDFPDVVRLYDEYLRISRISHIAELATMTRPEVPYFQPSPLGLGAWDGEH